MTRASAKPTALGRSFDVYYRDAARTARMDQLHRQFLAPDDLAFDIGAHVGDRTGSFLRLGANVVVVEPQPRVFRALRLLYGGVPSAVLHCAAVGATPGTMDLYVNSANPTISTASRDLISAANASAQWQGQVWDSTVRVPVTTLEQLITDHGVPNFVKIDVEGYEAQVLRGLSTPIPVLSFEFTTIQRDVARHCLTRMTELGAYEFNLSLGEDHNLRHSDWIDADAMRRELSALPETANSGDIFARRAG